MTPTVRQTLQSSTMAAVANDHVAAHSILGPQTTPIQGSEGDARDCVVVDGRVLPLQPSQLQGYTSMYAVIG